LAKGRKSAVKSCKGPDNSVKISAGSLEGQQALQNSVLHGFHGGVIQWTSLQF